MNIKKKALETHKKLKGKIAIIPKAPVKGPDDLKIYYTPGVAEVSSYLAKNKNKTREYTIKNNSLAVVSDGSAVLGLGNIGPEGALPVMEGKAMLFKALSNIDAFPIVLATQDTEKIIETVKNIAPAFGAIELEDISAPRCFEIEERLKKELDIPVMHDDQHATAIAVLAGLINALKVAKKKFSQIKVVIIGAGASGSATAKIFLKVGVKNILLLDSRGILAPSRHDLDKYKKELAKITNKKNIRGGVSEALEGADVVIGLASGGLISKEHIRLMHKKPIVFALSNPNPEIMPDEAKRGGAYIVATGRSDFPNQINNVIAYPGVFRGALDNNVRKITDEMKIKAAHKIASLVPKPTVNKIIPSVFDKRLVKAVASVIR